MASTRILPLTPRPHPTDPTQTIIIIVHGVKSKEKAGSAQVAKVRALAGERGMTLRELTTERPYHCEDLVAEADLSGVDAIGVMGGDGTMREGVSGMLKRAAGDRCPIFVLPVGTGNNFARDLGVKTVEDMFAVIDRGVAQPMDAMKVTHPEGSTYSINCVTWGMARDAAETAEGWRFLGPIRYDLAGFYHMLINKLNFAKLGASATAAPATKPAGVRFTSLRRSRHLTVVYHCDRLLIGDAVHSACMGERKA